MRFFPFSLYKVTGNSMNPTIPAGTIIVVQHFGKIREGTVVIAKEPVTNIQVIKRVEKISPYGYFIQGDNKDESIDSRSYGWIKKDLIIGKVTIKLSS